MEDDLRPAPVTAIELSSSAVPAPQTDYDHSLAHGIAWTALLRWAATMVSWTATFYAARILAPSDYGLIAMAMLGIGLARMAEDFGLDALLVQDRSLTGNTRARLAGLLLFAGVVLSALFLLGAYPLAAFFREPQVATIVMALSVLFIADALQVVPRAQLQCDLRFRRLAIATFVQVAATSVTLVIAARAGLGYWALVLNQLVGALVVTILLVAWYPYAVAWPRDIARLAAPLMQGWRILASRVAWYGYSNADQTIIGRVLGKDALGAYSFATTFSTLTQQEVGSVVSRVVPGIFSAVQGRRADLRRYFLLLTEFLVVLTFPGAIGMALVADLAIPLILGPQWDAVVVPLRLLCLYAAFLASQTLLSHVLMWTGQFRVNMWCSILAGVTMPLALLVAVNYGLEGIGWVWVLVFPLVNLPAFYYAFRTLNIGTRDWLRAIWPASAASLAMAVGVIAVRSAMPSTTPLAVLTAASIATGAIVYCAVLWFGFRDRVRALFDIAKAMRHRPGQIAPE